MLKVFDFVCDAGHRHEHFVSDVISDVECSECGRTARRAVSAPRFQLEGISGDFPGAAMAWEKKRNEKMAMQAKNLREHGDEGWT